MPGTARAYGLGNPFDPDAAIDAQAHLMSDLLRRFGGSAAGARRLQRRPAPGRLRRRAAVPRRPALTSPTSSASWAGRVC